jgi:hypothetical protein
MLSMAAGLSQLLGTFSYWMKHNFDAQIELIQHIEEKKMSPPSGQYISKVMDFRVFINIVPNICVINHLTITK